MHVWCRTNSKGYMYVFDERAKNVLDISKSERSRHLLHTKPEEHHTARTVVIFMEPSQRKVSTSTNVQGTPRENMRLELREQFWDWSHWGTQKSYNKPGDCTPGQPFYENYVIFYYLSHHRRWSLGTQPWIYFLQTFLASLNPFLERKILHPQKWSNGEMKIWRENKSPTVILVAVPFRSCQSLPSCCPAHTLLPRSPDGLMLLCEFSPLLFLDPRFGREARAEERGDRGVERQGEGWGKTGRVAMMPR